MTEEIQDFKPIREVSCYSDGGVAWSSTGKGSISDFGGGWAYCLCENDERFEECYGVLLPRNGYNGYVTNNLTELHALTKGILALPDGCIAHIYSDSQCSLLRVFEAAKLNGVPEWLVTQTRVAREKLTRFKSLTWTMLAGHPNKKELASGVKVKDGVTYMVSEHNVRADKLCSLAWTEYITAEFTLPSEEELCAA
jgi:ribonuclease HI